MVLTFLVVLALLVYAIMAEIDSGREPETLQDGECPDCRQTVDPDWLICPRCRTLLRENCSSCDRPTAVYHSFCPFCGRRKGEVA